MKSNIVLTLVLAVILAGIPYSSSASPSAEGAIKWAESQIGSQAYNLWCLKFARVAFAGRSSAHDAYQFFLKLGQPNIGASSESAPRGSLAFFGQAANGTNPYGHVGIALGGGQMISALISGVKVTPIAYIKNLPFLGWAYPPADWPGREAPVPPVPVAVIGVSEGVKVTPTPTISPKPVITPVLRFVGLPADEVRSLRLKCLRESPERFCFPLMIDPTSRGAKVDIRNELLVEITVPNGSAVRFPCDVELLGPGGPFFDRRPTLVGFNCREGVAVYFNTSGVSSNEWAGSAGTLGETFLVASKNLSLSFDVYYGPSATTMPLHQKGPARLIGLRDLLTDPQGRIVYVLP